MNAKTLMTTVLAAMLVMALEAAVGVKNVTCQQRYPWNGKVDIDYEVTSDDPNADVWVYPTGYDKDANVSMAPRALTGEGAGAAVKPGKHRMTWDVSADYPDFASTAFSVKMIALTGGAPYMVIDLSGGVDALSYPVSYLTSVPAGGWSDEYKTTKLVLRLIPPGTFLAGSPTDELGHNAQQSYCGYEDQPTIALTKPFYVGVFEITQKQYELVMGTTPSCYKGAMRPVEQVSYNDIRGAVNGSAWPSHNQVDANSFIGRLRSKINMLFDLPTEAQWEYACRAGSGAALNSGKNLTSIGTCPNMSEVGRYSGNCNDGRGGYSEHTIVGMYLCNVWGLYDMHGNVAELCLDWARDGMKWEPLVDPKGIATGSYRIMRGGCWSHGADCCRSASRSAYYSAWSNPDKRYRNFGFRITCSPAAN